MSDIVGIGAAVYDTLILTDRFPAENTKLKIEKTVVQGGGPCATALVAANRFGVSSEYMGVLGDDTYGAFMLEDFRKYGVGVENVIIKNDCVSFHSFVILNAENSSRTCLWNKGSIPALHPDEVNRVAIEKAKMLHLDGHQLDAAIMAAGIARENKVKVSMDAGGVYTGIEKLLPLIDFLMPSEEFALQITGASDTQKAAAALFKQYKPEIVVITQGSKGGFVFDGKEYTDYKSFKVNAIDSNGAGDVFHGAFIAGYIKGMGVMKAAQFASAAAALKCQKVGARIGVPAFDETIKYLRENGYSEF